jgi:hypothetical protein
VRIGSPDPTLTPVSGMVAVTELVERLDVIGRLDARVGSIKQRRRGHTGGQVLVGMAAAQLAGEDFPVGLDRQRTDVAGQQGTSRAGIRIVERDRGGQAVYKGSTDPTWAGRRPRTVSAPRPHSRIPRAGHIPRPSHRR